MRVAAAAAAGQRSRASPARSARRARCSARSTSCASSATASCATSPSPAATPSTRERVVDAVRALEGVTVDSVSDRTFLMHKGGKIEIAPKLADQDAATTSRWPTRPASAASRTAIHDDPEARLGADHQGQHGRGRLRRHGRARPRRHRPRGRDAGDGGQGDALQGVRAASTPSRSASTPRTSTRSSRSSRRVAPTFGGINLEDIAAPRCFEIERRLREELDIPVFHDDQHGTAIVVLAALLNALKVVGKRARGRPRRASSAPARPGMACTKIMLAHGVARPRRLRPRRRRCTAAATGLDAARAALRRAHQPARPAAAPPTTRWPAPTCSSASPAPAPSPPAAVRTMAAGRDRLRDGQPGARGAARRRSADDVAIMATGRSDYPNQINNVLAFPGVFRGALDVRARDDQRGDEARRRAGDRAA